MKHLQDIHRLIALVISAILILCLPIGVLAESYSAIVATNTMDVYADMWLTQRTGVLKQFTVVSVDSSFANVAQISLNGNTGFATLSDMIAINDIATKVVLTSKARIYQMPSTSSPSTMLSKGFEVNRLAVNGNWAMVERNGVIGYMYNRYLKEIITSSPDDGLLNSAQPAIITANTKVYQYPNTASRSLSVAKGMQINLIAVNGNWALVENYGNYAYMNAAEVVPLTEPDENDPTVTPSEGVPATITANTYAFQSPSLTSTSFEISVGTMVQLLGINGIWAMIEYNGVVAYVNAGFISEQTPATPVTTPTPMPTPDYSGLLENALAAIITKDTYVYTQMDTSSTSIKVPKGMQVQILKVEGNWALVENSGNYAYISISALALSDQATPTPTPTSTPTPSPTPMPTPTPTPTSTPRPTPTPVPDDYFTSPDYTNEQRCYIFLTQEAGLNTAAAAGILANIYRESRFDPTDTYGRYYGICQWGDGRLSNMRDYCEKNGYDSDGLEGQLRFLVYEMTNSYTSVLNYLKNVEDTAQGAYDAGYYFCYYYERPSNRESSSVARGELARDTYFPKYA